MTLTPERAMGEVLDKDPRAIAAGLSEGQRFVVRCRGIAYGHCPFDAAIMRSLVRRGLFSRSDRQGYRPYYELTSDGERVRAALQENRPC